MSRKISGCTVHSIHQSVLFLLCRQICRLPPPDFEPDLSSPSQLVIVIESRLWNSYFWSRKPSRDLDGAINAWWDSLYRAEKKSLQILLSSTQAGPGRKVKREQEEISRNHVPRLFLGSVVALMQHGSGSRVIAILVIREGTIFRPPN